MTIRAWAALSAMVLLGSFAGLTSAAFAEQNVPVNIPGGGAADLLNVTNIPAALDGSHDDSGVHLYCTDSYGRVFQKTDPAFEDCLAQRRKAGAAVKASPSPATIKNTDTSH